MDPEDLREVISAYQKCVAETVQRFSGFVAKYMGDGVLVYFGYPQAHEDDAERAVRAGLELVAAVGDLKTHATLQTRIGIATGLVVVGDLIGSGASQEQAIVGETPNLAARLQGIAEPNSVLIAESTRKLVGNLVASDFVNQQSLPESIRQDIVERTDGIPLFVEEMTRAVLEAASGCRKGDRCYPAHDGSRPLKPARFADGAARPARPSERSSSDRSGDWARVLSSRIGRSGAQG
jgi:hypothetical protein